MHLHKLRARGWARRGARIAGAASFPGAAPGGGRWPWGWGIKRPHVSKSQARSVTRLCGGRAHGVSCGVGRAETGERWLHSLRSWGKRALVDKRLLFTRYPDGPLVRDYTKQCSTFIVRMA